MARPYTKRIYFVLAISMIAYFALVMLLQHPSAYAQQPKQSVLDLRIQQVERRLDQSDAEHFGERLARLESLTETNNKLLMGVFGAVILMLVEHGLRISGGRKKPEPLESD